MYHSLRSAVTTTPRNIVLTLVDFHEKDGLTLDQARKAALTSITSALSVGVNPKHKPSMLKAKRILTNFLEKGKVY
jgi:hypothetical protein